VTWSKVTGTSTLILARAGRFARSRRAPTALDVVRWNMEDFGYVRPAIKAPVIVDDSGEVIQYGSRWGVEGPPLQMYSVVQHPERFAPVVTVAQAMVEYLTRAYDVTVRENGTGGRKLRYNVAEEQSGPSTARVVIVAPNQSDAAPITFIFTDFPSVTVEAGAFFSSTYPDCGCEACDEEWSGTADALEKTVLAVVNGTFSELHKGSRILTRIAYPGGSLDGDSTLKDEPYSTEYTSWAKHLLDSLPCGWQPWHQRT